MLALSRFPSPAPHLPPGLPAPGRLPARTIPSRAILVGFLAFVIGLAAVGAFLAADILRREPSGPYAVEEPVPTSFGAINVKDVALAPGVSAQAMGMSNMQGHVSENQVQVDVWVQLTNGRGEPIAYAPQQFQLRTGSSETPISLAAANFQSGRLPSKASILANLRFIAPRDGSALWLEFRDPGRAEPIRIDLGRVLDPAQEGENQAAQGAPSSPAADPNGQHTHP